jgi:hypothetical protein
MYEQIIGTSPVTVPTNVAEEYAAEMHRTMNEGGFPGHDVNPFLRMRNELISPSDDTYSLTNLDGYARAHGWYAALQRLIQLRRVMRLTSISPITMDTQFGDEDTMWGYHDWAIGYYDKEPAAAGGVGGSWSAHLDQVLQSLAQEWADEGDVLRNWFGTVADLYSRLPPNAPSANTVTTAEDTGWVTQPPPANSWWGSATDVRYAFAFHGRSPSSGTGPRSAWSNWFSLKTPVPRWRPTLDNIPTTGSLQIDKVVIWRQFRYRANSGDELIAATPEIVGQLDAGTLRVESPPRRITRWVDTDSAPKE